MRLRCLSLILLSFLLFSDAFAALLGTVSVKETAVLDAPDPNADIVGKLKGGTRIAVGNKPVQGFYKARLPSGEVGWVSEESLTVREKKRPKKRKRRRRPRREPPQKRNRYSDFANEAEFVQAKRRKNQIRVFGGMTFFRPTELETITGFTELRNGVHFGGELLLPLHKKVGFILRAEYLTRAARVRDIQTDRVYEFVGSSIPVSGGFEWEFGLSRTLYLFLGGLAGAGIDTKLVATSETQDSPNQTVYQGIALHAVGKVALNWFLSQTIAVYLETGYRYLKTESFATPSADGNGANIFQDTTGQFVEFPLDYSGFLVSGGLTFELF